MSNPNTRVSVAVRVRPVLQSGGSAVHQQEKFQLQAVKKMGDGGIAVEEQKPGTVCRSQQFSFDGVFDGDTSQLELYEDAVVDMIDGALMGNNFTVLAYGQTGSGKTHTILGDVKPNPLEDDLLTANSGVFLRVLSDLLEYRQRKAKDTYVVVGLSCIEIYNDKIRDLFGGKLSEDPPELKVQTIGDTVLTPGITTKEVTSMMSVFGEIQLAIERRQSRATEANATSSRSHCIFQIDILQQSKKANSPPNLEIIGSHFEKIAKAGKSTTKVHAAAEGEFAGAQIKISGQKETVRFSRILVCDLAGSEKLDKSGVTGAAAKEAKQINMSLTYLGNVVHALHEGGHVNYRDSSLTRLLMPAFNQPTSRVLLLAHCSPTQMTYDESVSTLHFANKVKAVKVDTSMNEVDNTIPDFLKTVRDHDMYSADLRIFGADTQAKPTLSKNNLSALSKSKFRCLHASAVPSEQERIAQMNADGAFTKATLQIDEIKKRERKEQEEAAEKLPELVQSYASSHTTRMRAAIEQISKFRKAGLPFLEEQSEDQYLTLCEEADCAFASFEATVAEDAYNIYQAKDKSIMKQIKEAKAIALPKVQMSEDYQVQVAEEDLDYSNSCASHCNGRRFLNSFLEMRDNHAALLVAISNVVAAETWLSKQPNRPKNKEDNKEKNGDGDEEQQDGDDEEDDI